MVHPILDATQPVFFICPSYIMPPWYPNAVALDNNITDVCSRLQKMAESHPRDALKCTLGPMLIAKCNLIRVLLYIPYQIPILTWNVPEWGYEIINYIV